MAASPNKQGDVSGLSRQCLVGYVLVDVILTAKSPADKQVFQHDGALEEVDDEIYQLIKQEKGRQVSRDTTKLMFSCTESTRSQTYFCLLNMRCFP